ncbi:hypothetical protein MP638_005338, partial [Amoeboaphelidium occidentale]
MKFISALLLLTSMVEVYAQQDFVNKMVLVRGEPVGKTLPGYPVTVQTVAQCNRFCMQASGCVYALYRRSVSPPYRSNCWLKADSVVKPQGQGVYCLRGFTCRSSKKTPFPSLPPSPTPTPLPPSGPPAALSGFSSLSDVEPVGGTLPGFPLYNLDASSCQERCRQAADCKYVLFKREPTQSICWIKPSDCELKPLGQGVMCPNDGSSTCASFQKDSTVQPSPSTPPRPSPTPPPPSGPPAALSGFSSLSDVEPVGGTLP